MTLLTAIVLLPLLTGVGMLFIPRRVRFGIRLLALASTFLTMLFSVWMLAAYDGATAVDGYKFVHQVKWVPSLGISFYLGVDGINLGLIVMGAIVAFAAACASWEIDKHEKEFYVLLMFMIGGILGAFASLDFFFFYFFHELALVPTFIMIGVWGKGENKNYATFNITLYLSAGALIALFGLVALYVQSGAQTFDMVELGRRVQTKAIPLGSQYLIFPLLMFGFGILVSLWPFHTWAPIGYGAAPTPTAMLHAGVLKKFGLYGLIRIGLPLVPEGAHLWLHILAFLCLGNILFCGLVAMRQKDLNLLIGNSSVAHMGFAFLGIASLSLLGITGTVMIMVAHGLLAALLFGLSGWINSHAQTVNIEQMGGLLKKIPFIGAAMMMAMFAGCGLPGFGNFAGEIMVLFGSWKPFSAVVVLAAWGGLIIGAVYLLRAVRNILHGPMAERWAGLADASPWRRVPFVILLASLMLIGIWPRLLTDRIEPSVKRIVDVATAPAFKVPPKKSRALKVAVEQPLNSVKTATATVGGVK